ncbi:hypothetical protein TcG_05479 [Trypanosoma cruzi]|nr:hypothetical protein TcG_05479 [Trypanosoma cruzi]
MVSPIRTGDNFYWRSGTLWGIPASEPHREVGNKKGGEWNGKNKNKNSSRAAIGSFTRSIEALKLVKRNILQKYTLILSGHIVIQTSSFPREQLFQKLPFCVAANVIVDVTVLTFGRPINYCQHSVILSMSPFYLQGMDSPPSPSSQNKLRPAAPKLKSNTWRWVLCTPFPERKK